MARLVGRRREQGVTLVELMIVIGLLGMVVTALYNMFTFQRKSYSVQDDVAVMQQNVRVGLEYMVKEIRMAGYIPEGIPPYNTPTINDSVPSASFSTDGVSESLEEVGTDTIAFQADVDDDGKTEMVHYVLAFDVSHNSTALTREVWEWSGANWGASTGPQIVADNIDTIVFGYNLLADDQGLDDDVDNDSDGDVDEEGELKTWNFTADGQLNTDTERSTVRQINIVMTARSPAPDSKYINPQQGDHYRRRILASNINLRNLE